MHLELYDPYTDPSVYYDTLLPEKGRNPVYLYNLHTNICGEELVEEVQKMLRDRKLRGKSVAFGFGFIEVKLRRDERKYDIAALPTVCGGFLVSYTVEPESYLSPVVIMQMKSGKLWKTREREKRGRWIKERKIEKRNK
jgi:hypothetical protein